MVKHLLAHGERDPLTHMERYLRAKKLFTTRWKNQLVHAVFARTGRRREAAQKAQDAAK